MIQGYEDKDHFRDQNGPFVPNKTFWYEPLLLLSSSYWPFSLCKTKKNFYSGSTIMTMHHFWDQNCPFATNSFFWELLQSFSSIYWPLSLCKILKKIFQQIQSYEDVQFMGPKWPISSNENFLRKPVHELCFFYSWLSACQKSKSDINLLVKYWWLKNTEISLSESHFCL